MEYGASEGVLVTLRIAHLVPDKAVQCATRSDLSSYTAVYNLCLTDGWLGVTLKHKAGHPVHRARAAV